MVMVEVVHLTSQHQSLVQAGAEVTPLKQNLSVPTAAKFMLNGMIAQHKDLFVMVATKEDTLSLCAIHLRRHGHIHPLNPRLYKKVKPRMTRTLVKQKNVDIVDMVRSMGLHAKNSVNIQEMAIVHENPVFYTPVDSQVVTTTWEDCQNVMEPEICVATPVKHLQDCAFETKQINMITVHDVELKSAHYSNVSINGQIIQVKQDTGAEVNVMSKCMFDRLSNGTTRNTVLLNKTKTVTISGYGENSIEYI